MSDEQEFSGLDEIVELINELEKRDAEDGAVRMLNTDTVRKMRVVEMALKKYVTGSKVKIGTKQNEGFSSVGCVYVEGRNLSFKDMQIFKDCGRIASNVDIYPKTTGNVRIDFTFHGLTKRI